MMSLIERADIRSGGDDEKARPNQLTDDADGDRGSMLQLRSQDLNWSPTSQGTVVVVVVVVLVVVVVVVVVV